MNNVTERQFEQIAADAITAAEHVDCSLDDFVDGLDTILEAIKDRKRVSVDEIADRDRRQQHQHNDREENDA